MKRLGWCYFTVGVVPYVAAWWWIVSAWPRPPFLSLVLLLLGGFQCGWGSSLITSDRQRANVERLRAARKGRP